jgi:hypothetical protein
MLARNTMPQSVGKMLTHGIYHCFHALILLGHDIMV